jgi:hypothetical protein
MALFQGLLALAFLPVVALLISQALYPNSIQSVQDAVMPYIADISIFHTLIAETIPPRSEIPLVVSTIAHWSHYEKVAKIATALAELGYPVTFITGGIFEDDVKKLHPGITFKAIQGKFDKMTKEEYAIAQTLKSGSVERELYMMKKAIVDSIPDQHHTLQQVFSDVLDRWGDSRPILSLFDTLYIGHHPILLGSPGIKPDTTFGLSCHPITLDSNDTFPFHLGKRPAQGPDAKAIHQEANQGKEMDYMTQELSKALWEKYSAVGAVERYDWHMYHGFQVLPDHIMSLGVPEFEFQRSDLRPNVHYFGGLKTKEAPSVSHANLPAWWDDVAAAKAAGKQIIAVSQGTINMDLSNLLLPTLEALKERTDVLIVATTVAVEVADIPDIVVPNNTRIAKFVPYDLLLPQVRILLYAYEGKADKL